jgi:hypothetical protein
MSVIISVLANYKEFERERERAKPLDTLLAERRARLAGRLEGETRAQEAKQKKH